MNEIPQIHTTLARSYMIHFVASIIGLFADNFIGFKFTAPLTETMAIICFGVGPLLILWAQYTSRKYKNDAEDTSTLYFNHGPYRFMRNPTHLGLLILVTGYTLVSGSLIFFAVTLIGYLISNVFFKKYEFILSSMHDHYEVYKSKVKKIF